MRKRYIFIGLLLLLSSLVWAHSTTVVVGQQLSVDTNTRLTPAIVDNESIGVANECDARRFTVPSGKNWSITSIRVKCTHSSVNPPTSVYFRIYSNDVYKPNQYGLLASVDVTSAVASTNHYNTTWANTSWSTVTGTLAEPLVLTPGNYWVVQAINAGGSYYYFTYQTDTSGQYSGYAACTGGTCTDSWTLSGSNTYQYNLEVWGTEYTP